MRASPFMSSATRSTPPSAGSTPSGGTTPPDLPERHRHGSVEERLCRHQPRRILGRDLPVLLRLQPDQQLESRLDRHPRAAQAVRPQGLRPGPDDLPVDARHGLDPRGRSARSPASLHRRPGSRSTPITPSSPGPASSRCSGRPRSATTRCSGPTTRSGSCSPTGTTS